MDGKQIRDFCTEIWGSLLRLQTTLDDLRLEMKSLLHDLEATRRERDFLRKLLLQNDDRNNGEGDGNCNDGEDLIG